MIARYSAVLLLLADLVVSSPSKVQTDKCDFEYQQEGLKVDCTSKGFTDVPHGFPRNVSVIDLSYNQIPSIKNTSFPFLPHLRELLLFYNNIDHMEKDSLQNLPALSQLVLGGNKINFTYSALPQGLFRNIPLKALDLSFMFFNEENWSFPDETFSNLIHLESFATITPMTPVFGPGFESLSKLNTLMIQYCQPDGHLSKDALKIFLKMNITTASLSGCELGTIDGDVIVMFPKAINLTVKNSENTGLINALANFKCFLPSGTKVMNQISLIDINTIDVTLDNVRNNRSLVLTESMTRHLVKMCVIILILESNRIEIIEKNALNQLPLSSCLKYLDLSNNEILGDVWFFQSLTNFPFLSFIVLGHRSELSRFKSFSEENNVISYQRLSSSAMQIYPEYVPHLDVQKHLKPNIIMSPIRNSHIQNGKIFTSMNVSLPPELTQLVMTNFLTDIKISMKILRNICFSGGHLHILDVSNCTLTVMDVSVFGLEQLKYLDFSGNGFYELPLNLMKSFPALRILSLNYINLGITNISKNIESVFGHLQNLELFTLTHNNLQDLPSDVEKIPNISKIDVSYNSISQLSVDTRLRLDNVNELRNVRLILNLQGNILSCTCGSLDFITWMLETDVMFWNNYTYKCIDDSGIIKEINTVLDSYIKYWRSCISHFWLSFAICLLLVFLLVLTLCGLIVNNLLRLKCLVLRWFGTSFTIPERRDFVYDVFVYYSSKDDHRWVCNTFREKMETVRGLRLCIPDRDFQPGACTAEEILDAINNSWKTVIYLTETFLEDELCSFTLSSAVYASTNLMPNRLIILYSDAIFDHPLPRILTQLLDGDHNFPLDLFDDIELWDQLYGKILCWV